MRNEQRLLAHAEPDLFHQSAELFRERTSVITFRPRRLVRVSVAAHVRHGYAVACLDQRRHLVAPGQAELWPAMHQDDERAGAFDLHRQVYTARGRDTLVCHKRCAL